MYTYPEIAHFLRSGMVCSAAFTSMIHSLFFPFSWEIATIGFLHLTQKRKKLSQLESSAPYEGCFSQTPLHKLHGSWLATLNTLLQKKCMLR